MLLSETKAINDILTLIIKGAIYTALALICSIIKDFFKNIFNWFTDPYNFVFILLVFICVRGIYKYLKKIQLVCDLVNLIKNTAKDSF